MTKPIPGGVPAEARFPDGTPRIIPKDGSGGVWASAFVKDEDRAAFAAIRLRLADDYPTVGAADELSLDLLTMYLVRLGRLFDMASTPSKLAELVGSIVGLDNLTRHHLKELRATRASKGVKGGKGQGDEDAAGGGTSPAELASLLLDGDDLEALGFSQDPEAERLGGAAEDDDGPAQPFTAERLRAIRERAQRQQGLQNTEKVSHNTRADKQKPQQKGVLF